MQDRILIVLSCLNGHKNSTPICRIFYLHRPGQSKLSTVSGVIGSWECHLFPEITVYLHLVELNFSTLLVIQGQMSISCCTGLQSAGVYIEGTVQHYIISVQCHAAIRQL